VIVRNGDVINTRKHNAKDKRARRSRITPSIKSPTRELKESENERCAALERKKKKAMSSPQQQSRVAPSFFLAYTVEASHVH
jgi:hypothetical protein